MENLTTKELTQLSKRKEHAFGKDVYLLGKDKDGVLYWLESAKWECGWYWGFGYIETYTNNKNPQKARDIGSHGHWDSFIVGKQEYYDHDKGCFRLSSDYVHHINENKILEETVLTDRESWELSELMKTFYILKETAEVLGRGGAHLTNNPCADVIKNLDEVKRINEVVLPEVFKAIYKILTP